MALTSEETESVCIVCSLHCYVFYVCVVFFHLLPAPPSLPSSIMVSFMTMIHAANMVTVTVTLGWKPVAPVSSSSSSSEASTAEHSPTVAGSSSIKGSASTTFNPAALWDAPLSPSIQGVLLLSLHTLLNHGWIQIRLFLLQIPYVCLISRPLILKLLWLCRII